MANLVSSTRSGVALKPIRSLRTGVKNRVLEERRDLSGGDQLARVAFLESDLQIGMRALDDRLQRP